MTPLRAAVLAFTSAMDELLRCVEVEPDGPAAASVIWLHGLGADGHDFEPIVPSLGLPRDRRVRFVFPNAPRRAVTINMGLIMPAWYDIRGDDVRRDEDVSGVRQSAAQVEALLAREVERGVAKDRIVLAGFSQGGAIALHVGLRQPEPLAGLAALSTYLVCEDTLDAEATPAGRGLPVFQAHGTLDPMVAFDRGQAACERLRQLGCDVTWRTYAMGHEVCPEEIADIGAWLSARLPA